MLRTLFSCIFILFSSITFAQKLIIEPDMGRAPIEKQIKEAHSSIQIVMYGFTDPDIMHALVDAKVSGKSVQTLLEESPYRNESENGIAKHTLDTANINLKWANPEFKLTHQKTIITDNHTAMIMTFNLTKSSFKKERNFALVIDDPSMVKEIQSVFYADWNRQSFTPSNPNLVWSPQNSREKLINFIHQAKHDIKIYAQTITDYKIIGALANASRRGIHIEIVTSKHNDYSAKKYDYLTRAGVNIFYSSHYYIHAKVIIIDHQAAMLGSMNLTQPSIEQNRELSVITYDPSVIKQLENTFEGDQGNFNPYHFNQTDFVKKMTKKIEKISLQNYRKFLHDSTKIY